MAYIRDTLYSKIVKNMDIVQKGGGRPSTFGQLWVTFPPKIIWKESYPPLNSHHKISKNTYPKQFGFGWWSPPPYLDNVHNFEDLKKSVPHIIDNI